VNTATMDIRVGETFDGPRGPRTPITVEDADGTHHYVVSVGADPLFGTAEQLVFPTDADGEISSYDEVAAVDTVEEAVAALRARHPGI